MKRNKVVLVTCIVLAALLTLGAFAVKINVLQFTGGKTIEELRALYPAYDNDPPTVDVMVRPELAEIAKRSALIIIGDVVGPLESYTLDTSGEKGTPEAAVSEKLKKLGVEPPVSEFIQTKIKVLDVWKGTTNQGEVVVIKNSIFADYEPELKPGMKAVFILVEGGKAHEGRYWTSKYGFYYIADGNKVVSALSDEKYNKFTGMDLNSLKREIARMAKE